MILFVTPNSLLNFVGTSILGAQGGEITEKTTVGKSVHRGGPKLLRISSGEKTICTRYNQNSQIDRKEGAVH